MFATATVRRILAFPSFTGLLLSGKSIFSDKAYAGGDGI
jgi:hypothetical protein